ncbi:MAG: exonuclease SbcCD subunit D C-terminal domain-containing protein [Hahellaceae bacterium]|nr:exonuclease SbcCD subunit D C-terminal domain-containing protein [Hahellaceae bacterium]
MKLLHTSDWHLGQSLMKVSREREHRLFLDFLVSTVRQEAIDTVIVAGDIFDTTTPASYARELYHEAIRGLKQAGLCNLVLVGGNHDSVAVLDESRALLGLLNVIVVSSAPQRPEDAVFDLFNHAGEVIGLFCAVPFLRLRDVLDSLPGQDASQRQARLQAAIASYYQACYEAALIRRQDRTIPIVGSGHLTTVGGVASESVREIYIGTLDAFPGEAFPPFDYLALGHLHRAQAVKNAPRIRYSGAPIPMSFDEVGQQKVLLKVVLGQEADAEAQLPGEGRIPASLYDIPIPLFQSLQVIRGAADSVLSRCVDLARHGESVWLSLELEGEVSMTVFRQQLDQRIADSRLQVLCVRRVRQSESKAIENRHSGELLQHLQPQEVFERRLASEGLEDADRRTLTTLFAQLMERVKEENGHENSETAS